MTEPVNRTILLFDIERFSRRDDMEQAFLRRGLDSVVADSLAAAGVERTQQYREDRGDGLIILISGDVSKARLLRALLKETPDALRAYNRFAASSTQMRLRIVLASGEVAHDPQGSTVGGLVGHDLNQACRLLDADVLREALRQRETADCVLCVSAPVYEGVVRHGHRGLAKEEFHRVAVAVKDDRLNAWLYGPVPGGHGGDRDAAGVGRERSGARGEPALPEERVSPGERAEPGEQAQPQPRRRPQAADVGVHFTFDGGSQTFGGGQVAGDQIGVSGGQVTGDVIMGSVHRDSGGERR
ncbi:hypothetical protein AB0399_14390 [Streptomyces sp. NPDC088194]|uniref:hypothetical protein n=1 Tax=Streptomyces sp. NPDC088194 TaxID=3154931 RepID=UPI0034507280